MYRKDNKKFTYLIFAIYKKTLIFAVAYKSRAHSSVG